MGKLLLTLTLLAFSSQVLCNVVPNRHVRSSENGPIADSALGGFTLMGGHMEFYNGVKGCTSHVQRDDYVVTPGIGAHKLHMHEVQWNVARKSCMAEGGQLAILNSDGEAAILLNWMKQEKLQATWLGIHDQFGEGDWVTLKGETLKAAGYDKWNTWWPNQPDNYKGNENCGVLVNILKTAEYSGLGDVNCILTYPYFCKINLC